MNLSREISLSEGYMILVLRNGYSGLPHGSNFVLHSGMRAAARPPGLKDAHPRPGAEPEPSATIKTALYPDFRVGD